MVNVDEVKMIIVSWNLNGLAAKIDRVRELIRLHNPDIICLQEIRMKKKPNISIDGYECYYNINTSHDGIATFIRSSLTHEVIDHVAGRVSEIRVDGEIIINVYVKNAGRGLKNLDQRIEFDKIFREKVMMISPSIIIGDMNVDFNGDPSKAGCSPSEREAFNHLLHLTNLTDVGVRSNTWWWNRSCKDRDVGMRLDYALVTKNRKGSFTVLRDYVELDHAPILLKVYHASDPSIDL